MNKWKFLWEKSAQFCESTQNGNPTQTSSEDFLEKGDNREGPFQFKMRAYTKAWRRMRMMFRVNCEEFSMAVTEHKEEGSIVAPEVLY